MVKIQNRTKQK